MTLPIPKLLEYYYRNSSLLFLGCSLNSDRTIQVFRAIKSAIEQRDGDIIIPPTLLNRTGPRDRGNLRNRNAYLLRLGVTGVWFEKGQFAFVEGMLRLARNKLRYRGVSPRATRK